MPTNQPYGCAPIFLVNVEEKVVVIHRGRCNNDTVQSVDLIA